MPPQYPNPNLNNQILTAREKVPSGVPQRFLTFSALVFLSVLLIYFGLTFGYAPFLKGEIKDAKAKVDELGRKISAEDQKELTSLYSQIVNIERLLSSHVFGSRIFDFLEENTAPQVTYLKTDLSVPDRRVELDGVAATYDELVRQLAALEQAPEVERLNLESAELSGGVVRFKVNLVFKEKVFQP